MQDKKGINFKMKNLMKCVVFTFLLALLLCICTAVLNPAGGFNEWYSTNTIVDFYKQDKETVDVLYLGASGVYTAISPLEIYGKNGVTGYSLSTSGQQVWSSYYLLKEALKTQKPKIVFLECSEFFNSRENEKELNKRNVIDSMKFSKNKLDMINDDIYGFSNWQKLGCVFPLIRYHSRWNKIDGGDINKALKQKETTYKGYLLEFKKDKLEGQNEKEDKEKEEIKKNTGNIKCKEISEDSKNYLKKIKELCEQNEISLVFIKIPEPTFWKQEKSAAIYNYAEKNNISFIDLNYDTNIDIDWDNDTQDEGKHLNIYGAEKVGEYLINYLNTNFDLKDHREQSGYKKWDSDENDYKTAKYNSNYY